MIFQEKIREKLEFVSKLFDLFSYKEKLQLLFLIAMSLLMAIFQAIGIASVLPFINIVMNPDLVTNNFRLNYIYSLLQFETVNSFIIFSGFVVLAFILIGNFISAYCTWLVIHFSWEKNRNLSNALLRKYLSLPYVYFLNQNTADLGKNVLVEVQQLTSRFLLPLTRIFTDLILTTIILVTLLYVNPKMTLIILVTFFVLYASIFFYFSDKLRAGGKRRIEKNRERFKSAKEALEGIKDIKISGTENFFLRRFYRSSKDFSRIQSWQLAISQVPRYIIETVAFGGIVGLIMLFVYLNKPIEEIIPLASFFAFAGYRLMPALQEIFNSLTTIKFNRAVLDKIHDDMKEGGLADPNVSFNQKSIEPLAFEKNIQLENVYFSYPNSEKTTIEDINLTINKGNFVALIGTTGSGKTTLADLLLGLFASDKGCLKVDGIAINQNNVAKWQANVGYVPQFIYLSDDTITRNIAFGIEDNKIDLNRVKKAAQMANLGEFIDSELPESYHTVIGERGVRLSGGQRQRIGIARALYREPQILIFDEATSSLDNHTEEEVLKSIEDVAKFKTMIVIAHRLTTVKNCDRVYVMEKGRIVNVGSYEDIIEKQKQIETNK